MLSAHDPISRSATRQTFERENGLDRGFRFDERNRFLRTVGSFAPIRDKFDLAVGFGATTVNRHSVELLVLDAKCAPVREFRRVQWDEAEVVAAVKEALAPLGAATP